MAELNKYLKVFSGTQIPLYKVMMICDSLSEETLDRLAEIRRDRRIIKDLLESAESMSGGITDNNVNELLGDFIYYSQLTTRYCK